MLLIKMPCRKSEKKNLHDASTLFCNVSISPRTAAVALGSSGVARGGRMHVLSTGTEASLACSMPGVVWVPLGGGEGGISGNI